MSVAFPASCYRLSTAGTKRLISGFHLQAIPSGSRSWLHSEKSGRFLALARVEGGTFSRIGRSFCLRDSGGDLLDALLLFCVSPCGTSVGDLESNSSVDSLNPVVGAS